VKELNEYRVKLINRLIDAANHFRAICLAVKDPYAALEDGGWNVHQVAVHTRDVDKLVYGLRARRTAVEDNPEFPNFDGDAYMMEHYEPAESLNELLDTFVDNVGSLTDILRQLPVEAWSRESRHATMGGGFTLQTWVERDLAHIAEHLATVKKGR
jgi:DinB superfamily